MKMAQADEPDADFSSGVRGKLYRPDAQLAAPIHLEPVVLAFMQERAAKRGMALSAFVNLVLKKEIELIEAAS
jgi:hypothetical protein